MGRLERYLFGALIAALLFMCAVGLVDMARAAEAFPTPDRDRDGANTYCVAWAQTSVFGVLKHLKSSPAMRKKALAVIFQTHAEDLADPMDLTNPDDHMHILIGGEDVPALFAISEGVLRNGQHWTLSIPNKNWLEGAYQDGWRWARSEVAKGKEGTLRAMPDDMLLHELHKFCTGQSDVDAGGAIHAASNQAIGSQEWLRNLCIAKGMEADEILRYRASGKPIEAMRAELDATKMGDAQRAEMVEMLEAAYAWNGKSREFLDGIYKGCIAKWSAKP